MYHPAVAGDPFSCTVSIIRRLFFTNGKGREKNSGSDSS